MKKSDRTKQRLLEAAMAEFAASGFAGARVDRIAEMAGCNKYAIYAYFESKDNLFEAVFSEMVVDVITSVPMDAHDLPKYAISLLDHYGKHPEVLRLASWYELERAAISPVPAALAQATKDKIAAIKAAQEAGVVTDRFRPEHLLDLILSMSRFALNESVAKPSGAKGRAFRSALREAVERLVRP